MKMNAMELEYYEAGIQDASEARRIVVACRSARYEALCKKHRLPIGKQSVRCVDAYNKGVAHEVCRQASLMA